MRGDATRQLQELTQPSLLGPSIVGDEPPLVDAAHHGTHRDGNDVEQLVTDLVLVHQRLGQIIKRFHEGKEHAQTIATSSSR